MSPVKASDDDRERGKRLAAWLERDFPGMPQIRRAEDVLGVRRQSLENWIKGADMSNDMIGRILELAGPEVLAEILGVKVKSCVGMKTVVGEGKPQIYGKGVRFWYAAYIAERMRAVLTENLDVSNLPDDSRRALEKAELQAKRREMWRDNDS